MRREALFAARRAGHARLWTPGLEAGWPAAAFAAAAPSPGQHPLADQAASAALARRAATIEAALASAVAAPDSQASPLERKRAHGRAMLASFCRLIAEGTDRTATATVDGENAESLIRRWGFHAIDVTPCADGRLAGVIDTILRIPPAIVTARQSFAGAMFDVAHALRRWEAVELERCRAGRPNAASEPTRYLKIGVYHFSSADPSHEGCAAHGSDTARAAGALLQRLEQFAEAVRAVHGADAATLLVGVDTDTDAIHVHVPDAQGRMTVARNLCSRVLYDETLPLEREAGKVAIRDAVAACAGVSPDDPATEGMRWFCGYLLKNNFGQVEWVRRQHGGRYAEAGHGERLIVVGDSVDDVQLRNVAFQAQMRTLEEGAADLDIGIRVLRGHLAARHLPVPVLVHCRHDSRIPGDAALAARRAERLAAALIARHAPLVATGDLVTGAVLRAQNSDALTYLEVGA